MQTADTYRHNNWTTETEAHAHNKGLPKAGVTSFYDSLVLNRTLVFQMNGSAKTPRLRQAPNRQDVNKPAFIFFSVKEK